MATSSTIPQIQSFLLLCPIISYLCSKAVFITRLRSSFLSIQIYKIAMFFCLVHYLPASTPSPSLTGFLPHCSLIMTAFSLFPVRLHPRILCYLHKPEANVLLRGLASFLHSQLQIPPFVPPKFGMNAYSTSSRCYSLLPIPSRRKNCSLSEFKKDTRPSPYKTTTDFRDKYLQPKPEGVGGRIMHSVLQGGACCSGTQSLPFSLLYQLCSSFPVANNK